MQAVLRPFVIVGLNRRDQLKIAGKEFRFVACARTEIVRQNTEGFPIEWDSPVYLLGNVCQATSQPRKNSRAAFNAVLPIGYEHGL